MDLSKLNESGITDLSLVAVSNHDMGLVFEEKAFIDVGDSNYDVGAGSSNSVQRNP
ncbi:MAG: hypothetical protein Q7V56_01015 [Gammaproteobacteria bacterium]|nr:hypothetical protein [Gammaproteobacteria bacterium]